MVMIDLSTAEPEVVGEDTKVMYKVLEDASHGNEQMYDGSRAVVGRGTNDNSRIPWREAMRNTGDDAICRSNPNPRRTIYLLKGYNSSITPTQEQTADTSRVVLELASIVQGNVTNGEVQVSRGRLQGDVEGMGQPFIAAFGQKVRLVVSWRERVDIQMSGSMWQTGIRPYKRRGHERLVDGTTTGGMIQTNPIIVMGIRGRVIEGQRSAIGIEREGGGGSSSSSSIVFVLKRFLDTIGPADVRC